jgi:hypothetical protein
LEGQDLDLRTRSLVILSALGTLWLASGTQREHRVVYDPRQDHLATLEIAYAESDHDPVKLRELAQGYLDSASPGLAIGVIEAAPKNVQEKPQIEHVYARALLDQGRATDALAMEKKVLDQCALEESACDSWLVASATRRTEILTELVQLGIDDAQAHPEASVIAYHNATRQATLAVR